MLPRDGHGHGPVIGVKKPLYGGLNGIGLLQKGPLRLFFTLRGIVMQQWVMVLLCCVAPLALADGHGELGLEKRQPDAPMTVTSVTLGQ